MKIPLIHLILLFVFFLLTSMNIAIAQSDLRSDSLFFLSKEPEIENILENYGIAQFYRLNKIDVEQDKVVLSFNSVQSTADSSSIAWLLLQKRYDSISEYRVAKNLFSSLAFEMEIGKDSLELILGVNVKDFKVNINYNKKNGIEINEGFKNLKRTFKSIVIKFDELSLSGKTIKAKNDQLTMKEIRKQIGDYFKDHFQSRGTFFYDSQLDVLKENTNELTFEVSKLSKEILQDRNYFEFIRIEIKIQKNDKDFEIKYQIQGKYGSGIGFAPRRSEYRNMEPEFSDYLNRYGEKIEEEINQLLTH